MYFQNHFEIIASENHYKSSKSISKVTLSCKLPVSTIWFRDYSDKQKPISSAIQEHSSPSHLRLAEKAKKEFDYSSPASAI